MEEQIQDEITNLLGMIDETYSLLGLEYDIDVATRPESFLGEPELWDQAEGALKAAVEANGKEYRINEGDGAFYGPKIDIQLRDCLGRSWQCATIQLDFQLPLRFELSYASADNVERTPVVIHRAIAGSLERFFAILVEHFAGAFPTWLAPVQAILLPITDDQNDYAWEVARKLKTKGIRVEVNDRSEKMGYKIREAETHKIPYMLVVGGKEAESGQVAVRSYTDGQRGAMEVDVLIEEILEKIQTRALDVNIFKAELAEFVEDDDASEMEARGY